MAKRDRIKEAVYRRRYRENHPEQLRAENKKYQAAHREAVNAKARRYREADPERVKEIQRKYRETHRAELNAKSRAYRLANPEKRREYHAKRRESLRTAHGAYTEAQWNALCAWFGGVCVSCGSTEQITVDHVVPVTIGGTNYINNIQPLCQSCNSAKHDKTIDYRDPVQLAAFLESLKG